MPSLPLLHSDEAIIDSGLNLETVDKDRVGVIWASGIGGIETFFQAIKAVCTRGW